MRAFIAIELPANVRQALAALQQALAGSGADVKWVEPQNLHLTLRFLGEISEEQRRRLEPVLASLAQVHAPIEAACAEPGAFPQQGTPRVIWVGIGQGAEELSRLAEEIEQGVSDLAVHQEERRFTAHLTLGRVRSPRGAAALRQRLEQVQRTPPPPFRLEHVTLFQSTLASHGPTYTVLARFPFRSPSPDAA